PSLTLVTTSDTQVDLAELDGLTTLFACPHTGTPGEKIPQLRHLIRGTRGCTPQA
ncbi:hypothetical protein CC80DRAFT_372180, partial [Byssothecium circinans]